MAAQDPAIDALARWLNCAQTRRGAIFGTMATALALAPGLSNAVKQREKPRKRCPDGRTKCSGVCVDTHNDTGNCGSCGNQCDGDDVCRNGDCVKPKAKCTVCDDDDDCPFQSVQAAIDAATPGDVIIICEGTYRENIVIAKDIELRGVHWEDVILKGTGRGAASVIVLRREVTAAISGVSIEGGTGTVDPVLGVRAGGGIYLENLAALTLTDANVGLNAAEVGAGIFSGDVTRLTVKNTTVAENEAVSNSSGLRTFGGGIYARHGARLQISEDCVVGRNLADIGGGIYNQGVLDMTDSLLVGNEAKLDGGGLLNDQGVVTFTNVLVGRNTASTRGGGIHVDGGSLDLVGRSIVEENTGGSGGGINVSSAGKCSSDGAIIRKNDAREDGGALYSEGGEIVLTRTSVIDNEADERGGGIFNTTGFLSVGSLTLEASDIRNNKAGDTGGGIFNAPNAIVTVDANSRVRRNKPNNCVGTAACKA